MSPDVPTREVVEAGTDGPAMSIVTTGPGYDGYVVIDTVVSGTSSGGVRITHDLPLEEVRLLAREMTFKYALFHLPRGGAKAGLRMSADLSRDQRLAALEDFGRRLAAVMRAGIYYPGMDMNCGPDELRAIYRGAGIGLGQKVTDTSWFTAMSVFHALEACADRLDVSGRPVTLAVEGFGSVARHLATRLDHDRYRVKALATIEGGVEGREPFSPAQLVEAKERHGDSLVHALDGKPLEKGAVLTTDVDILLPSSRTGVISPELARDVRARAVVPISNAPYAPGAVEILHGRGIAVLPGYLSNVGGVLASSLFDHGIPAPIIESLFVEQYRAIVDGLLRVARGEGVPATELCQQLAIGHAASRPAFVERSLPARVYERFVRRRLPASVRARQAQRIFSERFRSLRSEIERREHLG